jgi:immune inhibitor A
MKLKFLRRISLQTFKLLLFTFCTALAMPPYPDLTDGIKTGKLASPDYLSDHLNYRERGINSPTYHPINSLYKKGTAPFGEFKPLVLLVDFSDKVSGTSTEYFDNLIFSGGSNSVRDYFREISYGNLDIISVDLPSDIGWLRAPQTYEYYVDHLFGLGYYPHNSQKLVEDLVALADSLVDLSQYDNDYDGYVDAVIVIHSGTGAEFTADPEDMWSHKWSLPLPFTSGDGVMIRDYTVQPEYWRWSGDMTIGVFCHELGHIFGLPDLYDIDGDSKGIGEWSLMAYGVWNGNLGSSPAHPDAWSRIELGFVDPVVISENHQEINVPAVEETGVIYRLWSYGESGNEYFLVENRQKMGYDSHIWSSGLLIWHVDETMLYNNCQWYPGYTHNGHYKVALKQADALWQLEKNMNYGDGGDPYPGNFLNSNFNSSTSPNSHNYLELETHVGVNNINSSAGMITCDFLVRPLDIKDEAKQIELSDFTLKQNFPNPFNSSTIISFRVRREQKTVKSSIPTTLKIYNVIGRMVRTLVNEEKPAGEYQVTWDGKDGDGNELSAGVYFYRLKTKSSQETKKMILLK